jgi:hypothetical protein
MFTVGVLDAGVSGDDDAGCWRSRGAESSYSPVRYVVEVGYLPRSAIQPQPICQSTQTYQHSYKNPRIVLRTL